MPRFFKSKKKLIFLVIILVTGLSLSYHFLKPVTTEKPNATLVVMGQVTEQNVPLTLSSLGNLLAPQSTMLATEQSGTISKIYFKNGQSVKQGTLLVQLDDTAQRATFNKDQAALIEAKAMYGRYVQLNKVDPSVLSRVQMDQVYATYQEAKATLDGDAKTLAEMQIRAPFAGVLGATTLSVGSFLNVGAEIVAIVNLNDLEAAYSVPETYFGTVALGQKVNFTSDAYPGKTFPGTVIFKSPLVDETSRSFLVRSRVDDPSGLSPGMLVHITQTLIADRMVLAVPTSALVSEVSGFGVYQVQEGHVIETYVQTGSQFGNYTEITSGLKLGDPIIIQGNEKVQPGMPVSIASGS